MTSTCDCKFNDIANNALENEIMNEAFGDVFDLISSSNIMVFKCFKYIFKHFTRSIGGWISLGLLLSDIAVALVYFLVESIKYSKYIFTLTKIIYLRFLIQKRKMLLQKKIFLIKSEVRNLIKKKYLMKQV